MTKSTYNGWKNHETWNCGLWFETTFMAIAEQYVRDEMLTAEDKEDYTHVRNLAESFCNVVDECTAVDDSMRDGFAKSLIQSALQQVDFHELADHYLADALPKEY